MVVLPNQPSRDEPRRTVISSPASSRSRSTDRAERLAEVDSQLAVGGERVVGPVDPHDLRLVLRAQERPHAVAGEVRHVALHGRDASQRRELVEQHEEPPLLRPPVGGLVASRRQAAEEGGEEQPVQRPHRLGHAQRRADEHGDGLVGRHQVVGAEVVAREHRLHELAREEGESALEVEEHAAAGLLVPGLPDAPEQVAGPGVRAPHGRPAIRSCSSAWKYPSVGSSRAGP